MSFISNSFTFILVIQCISTISSSSTPIINLSAAAPSRLKLLWISTVSSDQCNNTVGWFVTNSAVLKHMLGGERAGYVSYNKHLWRYRLFFFIQNASSGLSPLLKHKDRKQGKLNFQAQWLAVTKMHLVSSCFNLYHKCLCVYELVPLRCLPVQAVKVSHCGKNECGPPLLPHHNSTLFSL